MYIYMQLYVTVIEKNGKTHRTTMGWVSEGRWQFPLFPKAHSTADSIWELLSLQLHEMRYQLQQRT
jgi:hypothetical protein